MPAVSAISSKVRHEAQAARRVVNSTYDSFVDVEDILKILSALVNSFKIRYNRAIWKKYLSTIFLLARGSLLP